MRIWSKVERSAPPTATDLADEKRASSFQSDPEKSTHGLSDQEVPHSHHVDPDLEKRVIRKMDWRVVPLVAALCEVGQRCTRQGSK